MLNRAKLLEQVHSTQEILFADNKSELNAAFNIWQLLIANNARAKEIAVAASSWPMPTWQDNLGSANSVPEYQNIYAIIGVDGSQVYPDRHEGFDCGLINIGSIELLYAIADKKPVIITTLPYFVTAKDLGAEAHAVDLLDSLRTEFEFRHALAIAKEYLKNSINILTLFDGSLIFWHLESKEPSIKQRFITSYLALLQQFYEQKSLIVGYISLPKSKELVNIIRSASILPEFNKLPNTPFDTILDRDIIANFIAPGQRSTIFYATASILEFYPEHLKPCFLYFNNGYEVVRIELPAWIAEQEGRVDHICQLIADQVTKGYGYPVCLSEAHEAAVVTAQDREFFYQMLHTQALKHGFNSARSLKLQKKRHKTI